MQQREARKRDQRRESENVISQRFEETPPGQPALHKNVRPECSRSGIETEREPPAKDQVPKIAEENARPRIKLYQKTRNRHRLRACGGWLDFDLNH